MSSSTISPEAASFPKSKAIAPQTATALYDWRHFASRAGASGAAWVAEYSRYTSHVDVCAEALKLMQFGQIEQGAARLKEFAGFLQARPDMEPSLRSVMNRWYYGVAAYHHYCLGNLDDARCLMRLANEAIVEALSRADFLALLSVHCQEFCLHQARIARNGKDWSAMNHHLATARAMMEDRVPLCETKNKTPIFFETLAVFLRSLGELSEEEQESMRIILDPQNRRELFEKFVRTLMRIPNFAILYP